MQMSARRRSFAFIIPLLPQQRRAAIDVDFHPRHVAAEVRSQENTDVRYLGRVAFTLVDGRVAFRQHDLDADPLRIAHFRVPPNVSLNIAWANGIASDLVP